MDERTTAGSAPLRNGALQRGFSGTKCDLPHSQIIRRVTQFPDVSRGMPRTRGQATAVRRGQPQLSRGRERGCRSLGGGSSESGNGRDLQRPHDVSDSFLNWSLRGLCSVPHRPVKRNGASVANLVLILSRSPHRPVPEIAIRFNDQMKPCLARQFRCRGVECLAALFPDQGHVSEARATAPGPPAPRP